MKSQSLVVLACLFSFPIMAQTMPDEINYGPYESRYRVLERDTNAARTQLSQSQTSLAETVKYIRDMINHIGSLESAIQSAQSEISRLRNEIPEIERQISFLRGEDSQVRHTIRSRQVDESNMLSNYQQVERMLRPMEHQLARQEQKLREIHAQYAQMQQVENQLEERFRKEVAEGKDLEKSIESEKAQRHQLKRELDSANSDMVPLRAENAQLDSNTVALSSKLSSERSELQSQTSQVQSLKGEVDRLRAANAPAVEIAAATRQLEAARAAKQQSERQIEILQQNITRNEVEKRNNNNKIAELERKKQSIPGKLDQSEANQRQYEARLAQNSREVQNLHGEVRQARQNTASVGQALEAQRQEVRQDEISVARQRQHLANLGQQIEALRIDISNLVSRSNHINNEIARNSEIIRSHSSQIPQLEQGIRQDQGEILEGQRNLTQARTDERNLTAQVASDQASLAEVTRNRDNAQSEMISRVNLYNHYLNESNKMGSLQAGTGTTLGTTEGERMSAVLSKQNGVAVGRELGVAEAKYWGSVRGEIQGYEHGHNEGLASKEDIDRAVSEASSKAAVDAELYAQANFKPVFFEEYVQAEFKKPLLAALANKSLNLKALKGMTAKFSALEEAMEIVPPLSPTELAQSEQVKTALDGLIAQNAKDVKMIEAKASNLSSASNVFEAPTRIPFGAADCSQVYKGVSVFKSSCENSYKTSFQNNYVTASRGSSSRVYNGQFTVEFNAANISQREANFNAELSSAYKVGHAEGLRVGKIQIYQSTYASTYKTAYTSELEKARTKAKNDAASELANFLNVRPLLTIASTQLAAEDYRGGEEVKVQGKVKNVSTVALNGPVMVRVTEVINGEKVDGNGVLNQAAGRSITDLPSLKVKVSPTAKTGDKIIVRGMVDLPGDLYRPARQEKFELVQVLSANPAHDLKLNYNANPDIKGIFRRNIHFLTASIAPTVEEIRDGYKVTLTPAGDSAPMIQLQVAALDSGALAPGAAKDLRFSYLFNDIAKHKTVTLELAVSYKGKVLKKEIITLRPN